MPGDGRTSEKLSQYEESFQNELLNDLTGNMNWMDMWITHPLPPHTLKTLFKINRNTVYLLLVVTYLNLKVTRQLLQRLCRGQMCLFWSWRLISVTLLRLLTQGCFHFPWPGYPATIPGHPFCFHSLFFPDQHSRHILICLVTVSAASLPSGFPLNWLQLINTLPQNLSGCVGPPSLIPACLFAPQTVVTSSQIWLHPAVVSFHPPWAVAPLFLPSQVSISLSVSLSLLLSLTSLPLAGSLASVCYPDRKSFYVFTFCPCTAYVHALSCQSLHAHANACALQKVHRDMQNSYIT